ncbi:MAG TPA: glycosyltransferase [Candidatus Gastranaerophilales bacterium]|nr:glycosyltransferase [Candidatus Gastranaerophilales bacterium]
MNILLFIIYTLLLLILIIETPNKINYLGEHFYIIGFLGIVGIYRYSLWIIHLVRALIYEKIVYKRIKNKAQLVCEKNWMPERLYFMMASYNEDKQTLYNSVKSIIHEAKNLNLPVTLCFGSAGFNDEKTVSNVVNSLSYGHEIKVIFVRQNFPDKRLQISGALKALVRQGIKKNDPVIFMDGDSIIMPGCLRKCLPIFHIEPDIQALTTNEKAIVVNSSLFSDVLNLRFAIRNFHMNSLALSKKLLCLTGRFSVFRAEQITSEEFISRIENDYITDWYWDKIQFLSGDDKSTWYSLLKNNAKMLYAPDAFVYSIEKVIYNPFVDYINKLKRWSGNMLRNNNRALSLGVGKTGFFLWLILLDQRINMWTAIISPAVIFLSLFKDFQFACMLVIWVLFVKYIQSLLFFYYGRTINFTFPIIYYIHQILNGIVKIYMLFRLKLQKWENRNLTETRILPNENLHYCFARYATGLSLVIFLAIISFMLN